MTTAPPPTRRLTRLWPGRQDRTRDAVVTGPSLSEPHDAVPLLDEGGVARLEVRPVGREEQLEVTQLLARQHGRRVVAERAVEEERRVLVHGLAAIGDGPVHEELGRFRMWSAIDHAEDGGGGGQAVGRRHELDVRALVLEQRVAAVLGERAHAIVALGEAVEELSAGVEAAGTLLGELLPEVVAVELAEHVPLRVLHPGRGELGADAVLEGGIQDVLPRLGRLLRLHFAAVVGDAREGDANPREESRGRAQVRRLVARVRGRVIALVPALLLEIDGGRDVGELQHVHQVAIGRALRGDLRVERARLQPHVIGLDLREVFAEGFEQGGDGRFAVVTVVYDLALLLCLGDVGARGEVEHLGCLDGRLGESARGPAQDGPGGEGCSGLEKATSTQRAMRGCRGHGVMASEFYRVRFGCRLARERRRLLDRRAAGVATGSATAMALISISQFAWVASRETSTVVVVGRWPPRYSAQTRLRSSCSRTSVRKRVADTRSASVQP